VVGGEAGSVKGGVAPGVVSGLVLGTWGGTDWGPAAADTAQGFNVWCKGACPADEAAVGMNKGPFWPQPDNIAAKPTRACAVTKIFKIFNMLRL
jgi:hypothetical protein